MDICVLFDATFRLGGGAVTRQLVGWTEQFMGRVKPLRPLKFWDFILDYCMIIHDSCLLQLVL